MKILLIAGHGGIPSNGNTNGNSYADPGACSSYGIEAKETRRVVAEMVNQFKRYKGVEVSVYPTNRNAYADVKNGCVQVNFANYSYIFEVHFNSSASSSANGVEVWVTPNESSTKVEQNIVNKVASLGFTNRGVKKEYFAVITSAKNKGISSALVETCFISNKEDMNKYNAKFTQICGAMVDGIAEGFGLAKNSTSSSATNTNKTNTSTLYRVKDSKGTQLGAFSKLDNAKSLAQEKKAIVYDANSKVVVSYVPVATTDEVRRYSENGVFYPNTTINFRNAPNTSSSNPVQGTYTKGESVKYDTVVIGNRYNWISWISASTKQRRYMPISDKQTGEKWGYAV